MFVREATVKRPMASTAVAAGLKFRRPSSAARSLEEQLQAVLNDSSGQGGIEAAKRARVPEIIIGNSVRCLVEDVEELKANLHLEPLSQSGILKDREVSAHKAGASKRIAA